MNGRVARGQKNPLMESTMAAAGGGIKTFFSRSGFITLDVTIYMEPFRLLLFHPFVEAAAVVLSAVAE
jgi:hypothetical protein